MITQKFRAPRGRLPAAALQTGMDTWTNREKICLIEAIQCFGTDDWNEVSKHVFELTKGSRSKDWCSPLNCSRQFQCVMEAVGRQIRKRADGDKDLLAAIRQHFVNERVNELNILAEDSKQKFMNLFKFNKDVEGGVYDDRLEEIVSAYGTEANVDQDQEDENSGFYFAELSDLNEKVSLINQFIQDQIVTTSQPKEEKPESSTAPSAGVLGEEDEDLADLADIFPDMETFSAEDLDATLMATAEFEMMSPPDAAASRKGPTASPNVSPQLKKLVRTAIAGTSEDERPRNMTPSAGAPTLSMLLEMPPRDPGQPLPEIGTVTKAASSALEPSRQDRVSPYRSPSAATLEQLNIALANSPTRHQDQVKAKSSSPTLQRLLEGTMPLKKDSSEERATPSFSSSFSFIPAEEIKQEVEQVVSTPSVKTPQTVMLPTVSSPRKVPTEVAAQSAVAQAPPIEPKPEILELVASGESQASSRTEVQPSRVPVAETEAPVEIKEEKLEPSQQEQTALQPEEPMEIQPLPPDVQDKVNNLKDLVIIQNKGTVTPKTSPVKPEATPVVEEIASPTKGEKAPTKETPPSIAQESLETVAQAEIKEEVASPGITGEIETLPMPVLKPVAGMSPLPAETKGAKAAEKPEPMEVDEAYETPPEEPEQPSKVTPPSGTLSASADSDDELLSRKKLPAKTYSRKERYGEPLEMEDADDSSNSAVESAVKTGSPTRSTRTPPKTVTEVKRGRKSRVSESTVKQSEAEAREEVARLTRARSKPGSPQKSAPKTPAPALSRTSESESPAEPVAPRSTRSRASTAPVQTEPTPKKTDDKEKEPITDETPTPGRATRGRISSTTKMLESLPGIPFESNPSSPSSSTATSTNMGEEDKEQRAFRKSISILWDQIKSHKHAGQFLKPITDSAVPNYSKKVLRPMDLTTIKRNIDSGFIRNINSFERDIYLMLMNATMYNSSDHEIHQRTLEMEVDVRAMLESYKATQKALKQSQLMETLGPDGTLRSPVKLRSSARRSQKTSDSDADDVHPDEIHSGVATPQSTSDHETDEAEASRGGQKTRESSPDITSAGSTSGMKRRSRPSTPSSVHLALTSAVKAERTHSSESKARYHSPDVNVSGHP